MRQQRRRAVRVAVAALVTAAGSFPLLAAPASAELPGYVRLAQLSPDMAGMDVSVTSFRGRRHSTTFTGVAYGGLSAYQRLAPGAYTVSMRPRGAADDTPRVIRANLAVAAGKAYTVAGVGRKGNFRLRVISDNFKPPRAGRTALRVVQAASTAPVVDVRTTTGELIAQGARYPSTTPYVEIEAQWLTLRAEPRRGATAAGEKTVQVKPGSVYTALVLNRGKSGVRVVVRTDAAGSTSAPVGSVDAGRGATSDALPLGGPPRQLMFALLTTVLVAVVVAFARVTRTRRRTPA